MKHLCLLIFLLSTAISCSCQSSHSTKIYLGMPFDQCKNALASSQSREVKMAMLLPKEERKKGWVLKNYECPGEKIITLILVPSPQGKVIHKISLCTNGHLPKSQRTWREIPQLDLVK